MPFKALRIAPRAKRLYGYVIDEDGAIYSTTKVRRVRGSVNSKGYLQLSNKMLVHRVVAAAWCRGRSALRSHVNHKDGNKLNNHPANLEWCSAAENNAHARAMGLR